MTESAPLPPSNTTAIGDEKLDQLGGTENGNRRNLRRINYALIGMLFIGLVLRAWLIFTPGIGYEFDQQFFLNWMRALSEHGLSGFYDNVAFCNYPPLWIIVLYSLGTVCSWFDPQLLHEFWLLAVLKMPACVADLLIALLIYSEVRRVPLAACLSVFPQKEYTNEQETSAKPQQWVAWPTLAWPCPGSIALAAAGLYFLNPVTLYNSAYWGQVDAMHSLFMLLSLILLNRNRLLGTGVAIGLGLLQKFQSITVVPLILMELWMRQAPHRRLPGLALFLMGIAAVALIVGIPFLATGTLDDVVGNAYVNVVGQYPDLSRNAFNFWYLLGAQNINDFTVPPAIVRFVAGDRSEISVDASWLLSITWRMIALILTGLAIAGILSIYSLRATNLSRQTTPSPLRTTVPSLYGAAGLCVVGFFFFAPEMHERYVFPAVALLPIWAVVSQWRERAFLLFSMVVLLNQAAVLPPNQIGPHIAGWLLLLTIWFACLALFSPAMNHQPNDIEQPREPPHSQALLQLHVYSSKFVQCFQWLTAIGLTLFVTLASVCFFLGGLSSRPASNDNKIWLSKLSPKHISQTWGELAIDSTFSGHIIHLDQTYHLYGMGSHAPSILVYSIPPGVDRFRATVGVDRASRSLGSVVVKVLLNGEVAYISPILRGGDVPVQIDMPLNGASELTLVADPTPDGTRSDHIDWASARFMKSDS